MRASGCEHELRGCDRQARQGQSTQAHSVSIPQQPLPSTSIVWIPLCSTLPSKHRIHLLEAQQLLDRTFPMQTPALAGQHVWYWAIQLGGVQAQLAGATWEVLLHSMHGGTGIWKILAKNQPIGSHCNLCAKVRTAVFPSLRLINMCLPPTPNKLQTNESGGKTKCPSPSS